MKTSTNRPHLADTASSKKRSVASKLSNCTIKLKAVTTEDRKRLRIPSYQYLLP